MNQVRKNTIILLLISITGSFLGFYREILVAKYYGLGNEVEIFIIASTITVIVVPRISKAITSSFIPLYLKYTKIEQNEDFSRNILFYIKDKSKKTLFIFSLGSIILMGIALFINSSDYFTIGLYSLIMAPAIYFLLMSSIYIALHNIYKSFIVPSISNFSLNIYFIFFLYVSVFFENIIFLTISVVLYSVFQNIYLKKELKVPKSIKSIKMVNDKKYISDFNDYLKPAFLSAIAPIIPIFLMRYLKDFYENGDIVAFNYANLIAGLVPMLFSISLLTLLTPRFSSWYQQKKLLKEKINLVFILVSTLIIPLQLFLYRFSEEIITIFFLQGKFDLKAAETTSEILSILSFAIAIRIYREILIRYSLAVESSNPALSNTINYIILSTVITLIGSISYGILGASIGIVIVEIYNIIAFIIKLKDKLDLKIIFVGTGIPLIISVVFSIFIIKMNIILSLLGIFCILFLMIIVSLNSYRKLKGEYND